MSYNPNKKEMNFNEKFITSFMRAFHQIYLKYVSDKLPFVDET